MGKMGLQPALALAKGLGMGIDRLNLRQICCLGNKGVDNGTDKGVLNVEGIQSPQGIEGNVDTALNGIFTGY